MKVSKEYWAKAVKSSLERRTETNEVDFKSAVSSNNERLKEHINAFGNSEQGGVFVFGVSSDFKLTESQKGHESILSQISKLARDTQVPPLSVEGFLLAIGENEVLAIEVCKGTQIPVFIKDRSPWGGNGCYKRVGDNSLPMSEGEIRERLAKSTQYIFDKTVAEGAESAALDFEALEKSVSGFRTNDGLSSQNIRVLMDEKILVGTPGNFGVSVAGWLVFGKNPQSVRQFKNAHIEFQQFRGVTREDPIKKTVITGNLATQVKSAMDLLNQHLWVMPKIQGAIRQEIPSYDDTILREILSNSVVHRDYQQMHQPVKIALFRDRFEVENPGGLMPGLTSWNLIHRREWRNPTMAQLLSKVGIGDMDGQGIDRLFSATRRIRLPAPIFIDTKSTFKVTLSGPKRYDDFTPEEKRLTVLILLIMEKAIDNESLRNAFEIDASRATTLIKALVDENVVEPTTKSRKYAQYKLTEQYHDKIFG
jgi:ATP-dependent DNA helicase RecG